MSEDKKENGFEKMAIRWQDSKKAEAIYVDFEGESDRAGVVLLGAMLDHLLEQLLKKYLVASPTTDDELCGRGGGAISTMRNRIELAYRLGLVSDKLRRDLDLIRKIRNEFAHNVTGCSFQEESVVNRIYELRRSFESSPLYRKSRYLIAKKGEKFDFQYISALCIVHLQTLMDRTSAISQRTLEWMYTGRSPH